MASWNLLIEGVAERSLANWGLSNVRLTRLSLALDTLEATRDGADFDANPLCNYLTTVTLRDSNGIVRFVGKRINVPADAAPGAESQTYLFAGPWYYLEHLVMHQVWVQYGGAVASQVQTSHLLLNAGRTVGEEIEAIIDYAITQGAPIQREEITIATRPPISEVIDQYCAAAIIDQMKWAPDAVLWFDYSTSPYPTIRCQPLSALTRVQLDIDDATHPSAIQIIPRHDQVVPAVALRFEAVNSENQTARLQVTQQIYPPAATGRELNAIAQTITLQGTSRTTVAAEIECETIDLNSVAFWKNRYDPFNTARITNLAIVANSTARTGTENLPRMLIDGAITPWMLDGGINAEKEFIGAEFTFDAYDRDATDPNAKLINKSLRMPIAVEIVATDAPAGITDYATVSSFEAGETVPADLAQFLYNSLSVLEYEGTFQLTENECSGSVGPGNLMGLLGSRSEYEELVARVQRVIENIDTGITDITFGPNPHLSLGALIELLRANRVRRRWTAESTQQDGGFTAANNVELGKNLAKINSMPGEIVRSLLGVSDGDAKVATLKTADTSTEGQNLPTIDASAGDARQIVLRTADCVYNGTKYTIAIRPVSSCRINPTSGQREEGIILIPSSTFIPQ